MIALMVFREIHSADGNLRRITKVDKDFTKLFDSKNKTFPVRIRDICEIEEKNSITISVFGYENKQEYPV